MNPPALQLDRVAAGYPHRPVLFDLSLEVEAGQVLALIGPNGAGKSTILRVCSGVLHPTSGRVLLAGQDMAELARADVAKRVSVVAQESVVPPAISGREMVELGRTPHLRLLFGPGARDRAAVDWALEVTGADHLAGRLVEELSGGERQRILLARALAQQPRVLLLDEPTANLDLQHQVRTLELVRRLARQQGLAVVAAVHDLQLAALFSDRVALLGGGRLRLVGTPEETFTADNLGEVFDQQVVLSAHPTHGVPLVALVPGEHARRAHTSDTAC